MTAFLNQGTPQNRRNQPPGLTEFAERSELASGQKSRAQAASRKATAIKKKLTPDEEALALKRRLAGRGGVQSTVLTSGRGLLNQPSIFKRNLGGT